LVILLKPGERQPPVPPGPSTTVVARPFRLIELVALLERPPTPPAAREGDAEAVDAEGEREGEGEPPPVPLRAAGRLPRPGCRCCPAGSPTPGGCWRRPG
jgi:hypothetical protein